MKAWALGQDWDQACRLVNEGCAAGEGGREGEDANNLGRNVPRKILEI